MNQHRTARSPSPARWLLALGLIASPAALLLPACSGGGGASSKPAAQRNSSPGTSGRGTPQANEPVSISTGLNALESGETVGAGVDPAAGETIDPETARRLALMDEAQHNSQVSVDGNPQPTRRPPSTRPNQPKNKGITATEPTEVDAPEPSLAESPAQQQTAGAPPASLTQRKAQLAGELAGVLREEAAATNAPAATMARLAALDLIQRGSGDTGSAATSALITPRDADALKAWREFIDTAGSRLDSGDDLSSLSDAMASAAGRLNSGQPLRLSSGRLCTRVDGFGVFTELRRSGNAYKLLAGRKHRVIVYVEAENFGHRQRSQDGVSGYSVELTQELNLFHASTEGDMLAWRKTDQAITDFSANRRRDFFVVQVIELPETLSIGGYRLKVSMKDKATGASAETIIPIDVVADASAMGSKR